MKLIAPITQPLADSAVRLLARHLPDDVDSGVLVSASLHLDVLGRRVHLASRAGHWLVRDSDVQHLQRIDSPLDEPWDATAGQLAVTTYVDGALADLATLPAPDLTNPTREDQP